LRAPRHAAYLRGIMLRAVRLIALALVLLLALPAAAQAQTLVRISAGVTASSPLVKDFLGGPITVEQAVPLPTFAVQLSHTLPSGYRLGVEGRLTSGTTEVSDNGTTEDLGTVRTLSVMSTALRTVSRVAP
jgi:hypothetical protein